MYHELGDIPDGEVGGGVGDELTGEGVSVGERTVGAAGECGEGGACGDSAGGGGEYFDCLPA